MGDENKAEGIALLQLFEQVDDVGFGVLVEVACRFVSEQQPRRIDQRAGDHNPALLAAGHIAWVGIGTVGKTDPGKEVIGSSIRLRAIHRAAQQRRDRNVVHCCQVRQQAWKLKDEANVVAAKGRQLVFRKSPDIGAVER